MPPSNHKEIAVYRGVPDDTKISSSHRCNGILALLFGLVLSLFAWIANQGWTVLSLMLFGPFEWSAGNAWKHLIFCTVGSVATSIAWCSLFKLYFTDDADEEDREEWTSRSCKRDVMDALQDLGELGFVIGYLCSQYVGIQVLNASGYITVDYSNDVHVVMGVLLLVWVFLSKVKDYRRATKRANAFETDDSVHEAYYVQLV
eukprot:CCRYP_004674-RA/>CCRYP_004674-RA protein AED:0.46 eAED:0.46 QI:0/-1/0/1/-1/1/1/0/201